MVLVILVVPHATEINAPHAPAINNFTETAKNNPEKGFVFYAKKSDSLETEEIKTYVVYLSQDDASLGKAPFHLIAADAQKNFQFTILQAQIPANWNGCYIAITAVDRENNESALSNIVQLVKTNKGWAIPK